MSTPSSMIIRSLSASSNNLDIPNHQQQQQLIMDLHSTSKKEDQDVRSLRKKAILQYLPKGLHLKCLQVVLAEVVGTFILVMGICGISASARGSIGLLEYALVAGGAVVVAFFCTNTISGAHINPANTIAFAMFGHFPWVKVPLYVMAQVGGSALATYVGKVVYDLKSDEMLTVPYSGCAAAFWAEFLASFIVTFVVVSMAKNEKTVGQLMGIVMGIAVMLAVLITGPISGGSLNPARSLGPAIVAWKFNHIWVYLLAPTTGSVLGVFMIHVLCLENSPSPT